MNATVAELADKIRALEAQMEVQLALARAELTVRIEDGRVQFAQEVLRRHRELQTRLRYYILGARPLIVLTSPFIYMLIVPLVALDVFFAVYQWVCFPVYGIPRVRRKDYLIFDRRYLAYLNPLEKLNCAYCSYANGLLGYAREIGSRTEQYWCPIKHARKVLAAHPRYSEFVDYGDAEGFKAVVEGQKETLRKRRGA